MVERAMRSGSSHALAPIPCGMTCASTSAMALRSMPWPIVKPSGLVVFKRSMNETQRSTAPQRALSHAIFCCSQDGETTWSAVAATVARPAAAKVARGWT